MKISVNGQPIEIEDGATAADLIVRLAIEHRRVAMEINREIVPRSSYANHRLFPDDEVEIVGAIGGG